MTKPFVEIKQGNGVAFIMQKLKTFMSIYFVNIKTLCIMPNIFFKSLKFKV